MIFVVDCVWEDEGEKTMKKDRQAHKEQAMIPFLLVLSSKLDHHFFSSTLFDSQIRHRNETASERMDKTTQSNANEVLLDAECLACRGKVHMYPFSSSKAMSRHLPQNCRSLDAGDQMGAVSKPWKDYA